jgi:hypothetical protein
MPKACKTPAQPLGHDRTAMELGRGSTELNGLYNAHRAQARRDPNRLCPCPLCSLDRQRGAYFVAEHPRGAR